MQRGKLIKELNIFIEEDGGFLFLNPEEILTKGIERLSLVDERLSQIIQYQSNNLYYNWLELSNNLLIVEDSNQNKINIINYFEDLPEEIKLKIYLLEKNLFISKIFESKLKKNWEDYSEKEQEDLIEDFKSNINKNLIYYQNEYYQDEYETSRR